MLGKSWAVALLLLPLSALAAEGLSYNYVEADYFQGDIDVPGGEVDFDGFALEGSFGFNEMFYVTGQYADASIDETGVDGDSEGISLGIGGHTSQWTGGVDLFGVLSYERAEVDISVTSGGITRSFKADDDGFGVEVGLRSLVTAALELNGSVKYVDVGDADGTGFEIGAVYSFTPTIAALAAYQDGEDSSGFLVGGRLYF
ncbi:MAG: outer membrane beta-barrel protein [Nevskiales bacterium]